MSYVLIRQRRGVGVQPIKPRTDMHLCWMAAVMVVTDGHRETRAGQTRKDVVMGVSRASQAEVHCCTSWLSRTHRMYQGQLHNHRAHVRNTICLVFYSKLREGQSMRCVAREDGRRCI